MLPIKAPIFFTVFLLTGTVHLPTPARPISPPLLAPSPQSPLPTPHSPLPIDTPEEILRTEIITQARSPLNGEPLTAAEYAQLQEALRDRPTLRSDVAPGVRNVVRLLYIRRAIRSLFPFLLQSR